MLEISLRRGVAALLQLVEIVFYLFGIQFSRKTLKVKSDSSNMTTVIVECSLTSAKNGNVALKTLK